MAKIILKDSGTVKDKYLATIIISATFEEIVDVMETEIKHHGLIH